MTGDGLDGVTWYAEPLGLLAFIALVVLLWAAWGFHRAGLERIRRYERRRAAR